MTFGNAASYLALESNFYGHKQFDAVSVQLDPRMMPFLAPIMYDDKTDSYTLYFANSNYGCIIPELVHAIQNRCLGNPLELEETQHADSNELDMMLTVGTWNRVSSS